MSDEEILRKAIEKIISNGYRGFDLQGSRKVLEVIVDEINSTHEYHPLSIKFRLRVRRTTISYYLGLYELIFSHEFAKAFWGEELIKDGSDLRCHCGEHIPYIKRMPSWQYHLQQMVLEENPLQYLKQFLDLEGEK